MFFFCKDFENLWIGILLEHVFDDVLIENLRHIGSPALVQHVLGSCQSPCCQSSPSQEAKSWMTGVFFYTGHFEDVLFFLVVDLYGFVLNQRRFEILSTMGCILYLFSNHQKTTKTTPT